jgi:hypothetical protein
MNSGVIFVINDLGNNGEHGKELRWSRTLSWHVCDPKSTELCDDE